MDQAKYDAEPGQVPVVAWRQNHAEWVAILSMNDLMNFVREFISSTKEEGPAQAEAQADPLAKQTDTKRLNNGE
jgi:gas vesicle GvpC-like protein